MSRTSSGVRRIRKILLVEDHPDTLLLLSTHFARMGYHVTTAADGNEALAAALDVLPDVIVLDLAMPHLDGWDTVRLLRCYPTTAAIPVIACTAIGSDEGLGLARARGCNAVIRKPCIPDDVERAVDVLLAAPTASAGVRE